jgi:hypothetical protein
MIAAFVVLVAAVRAHPVRNEFETGQLTN